MQERAALQTLRILRVVLSLLVFMAIGAILQYLNVHKPDYPMLNFFSYFTNQSNIMVALFFMADAILRWCGRPLSQLAYDRTRGALILYMSMTTSIYWLFLHGLITFSETIATAANIFLHSGCLTMLVLDWIVDRPET